MDPHRRRRSHEHFAYAATFDIEIVQPGADGVGPIQLNSPAAPMEF